MKKLLSAMLVLAAVLAFVATSYAVSMIADDSWPNLNLPSDNTWYAHTFNISGQTITPATLKIYVYDDNDDQVDQLSELSYVTLDGVNDLIGGVDNPNDRSYDVTPLLDPDEGDYEVTLTLLPLRGDFVYDKAELNVETQKYADTPIPSIGWLLGLGLICFLTLRRRSMKM